MNRGQFLRTVSSKYEYNFSSDLLKKSQNWSSLEGNFAVALIDKNNRVVAVSKTPILNILEIRRTDILEGTHKITAVVLGHEDGNIGRVEYHALLEDHPNAPVYLDFREAKENIK